MPDMPLHEIRATKAELQEAMRVRSAQSKFIPITVEQAREIWENRQNGGCSGTSPSKGGRAWLDGEFQLCELEALCVILRAEAGDAAEGAPELIEIQKGL